MKRKTKYDRDQILLFIQKKDWHSIVEKLKDNDLYRQIKEDPIADSIISANLTNELITGNSYEKDSAYPYYLTQFHILHNGKSFDFKLGEADYKKLVLKIVNQYNDKKDITQAYNYAKEFPEESSCIEVIKNYESIKTVNISPKTKIKIQSKEESSELDSTISLFKSTQEYVFYKAVRDVFPTYLVFPNVAVSAVVDFDSIKDKLNNEEKSYFFKCLIDSVVIDPEKQYHPIQFVELDSIYHDTQKQQQKDNIKDKIISLAGHKLYRIRVEGSETLEKDFIKLIRDEIRK